MAFSSEEITAEFEETTSLDRPYRSEELGRTGWESIHEPALRLKYRRQMLKKLGWPSHRIRSEKAWAARKPCACGCGQLAVRKYVHGHYARSKEAVAATRIKRALLPGWSTPGPQGGAERRAYTESLKAEQRRKDHIAKKVRKRRNEKTTSCPYHYKRCNSVWKSCKSCIAIARKRPGIVAGTGW